MGSLDVIIRTTRALRASELAHEKPLKYPRLSAFKISFFQTK